MQIKNIIAVCVTLIFFSINVVHAQMRNGVELIVSPLYSLYDNDMLHPYQNVDDPWSKSIKYQLRYNHIINGNHGLVIGLAYSQSSLNTGITYSSNTELNESLNSIMPKELGVGEFILDYTYAIFISEKISINPELGLSVNIPYNQSIDSLTYENGGEVIMEISNNKLPTPNLAVNAGIWLKYSLTERNVFKVGLSGSLPLFKTSIATFTLYPGEPLAYPNNIITGCTYYGLGIGYQYWF